MLSPSRRIFLYWLLLLLPTLLVGAVAIHLLKREQARIAASADEAAEARRAAVAARARLVGENIELLTGDVQTGLLDTLAAEPQGILPAFLDAWERDNPFVRTTFLVDATGKLQRPRANGNSEEERGFLRRFSERLAASPPWGNGLVEAAKKAELEDAVKRYESDQQAARAQMSSNVAKVQAARRNAQSASRKVSSDRWSADEQAEVPAASPMVASANRSMAASLQADAGNQAQSVEQRGWNPWVIDNRLHLVGWVRPAGSLDVRGLELELTGLIARLGGALPAEVNEGEGYALWDEQGRVMHQVGSVSRSGEPLVRVPLSETVLPGWEVVAFSPALDLRSSSGESFFLIGSLLVGIFVVAIVTGGSLLLRQARRSEAEAAQKTSFVANVSHEFKTPLTTIRLYAELLEQGRVRNAAQGDEYLRTIGRETQRLSRLVGNVLDFSGLEQGKKKFARESVELVGEVERWITTQSLRLAEAGLTVTRSLPSAAVFVTTDRDALEQIFLNLLENACKYAGSGGELHVEVTSRATGGAELCVMDRGPGVPAAHRERIFEKFHRVDDTLAAEKGGAGLGLSIARQLARGLGGDLRYETRAGGGAMFVLELP